MQNPAAAKPKRTVEVEIPKRMHPVLVMLVFLPLLLMLFMVASLIIENVPIPLMLVFAVLLGCCGVLCREALKIMLGGSLVFSSEGLTIKRFMADETLPWAAIEAAKVTPATGTFGDNPLLEQSQRVGLGLFLRKSDYQREHELDPDQVICAGDATGVQRLMQIAERLQRATKQGNAPKRAGARTRQTNQRKEFRQRPQPAADPVANFRKNA